MKVSFHFTCIKITHQLVRKNSSSLFYEQIEIIAGSQRLFVYSDHKNLVFWILRPGSEIRRFGASRVSKKVASPRFNVSRGGAGHENMKVPHPASGVYESAPPLLRFLCPAPGVFSKCPVRPTTDFCIPSLPGSFQ